jgi:hypothetical protein
MDSWGRPNGVIPYRWAGVAPLAELLDVRQKANNVAKWSLFVSQFGLDISNHSNSLSFDGHYDELNAVSDALVRGDAQAGGERVPPRLQVHSAGNQGQKPTSPATQVGYFSLTRQVKNALVVGNYDFLLSAISPTSSLGPTYDGRIKPDLVAPGARITSTGFCGEGFKDRCTNYPPGQALRQDFYRADSGSSFAAAAVTGGLALVLEQYGTTYGVNLDASPPLPSTLRGIAIHSARDLEGGPWKGIGEAPVMAFPGPDFVTGWGLLDVAQAVLTVRRREILESSLRATCDSVEFVFAVPTDTSLKVTLAWDDPAAPLDRPPGAPLLVNDLDLVLVAPDGTRHRPWLLDQVAVNELGAAVGDNEQRCGTALGIQRRARPGPPEAAGMDPVLNAFQPAVRGRDHLNNVEQVLVQSARRGEWRAWVIGFGIPQGPQRFSLIGIVPKQ